jgi:two-component system NtrC family sensor kinase
MSETLTAPASPPRRWRLPGRRSLVARLVLTFLILSVLMVGVVGVVSYLRARDALQESVFDRLDTAAGQKADSVDRWVDEQRRNVVFAAGLLGGFETGSVELSRNVQQVLEDRRARRGKAHDSVVAVLQYIVSQTADAQEILVLDLRGRIVASTVPAHEGLSQTGRDFFERGSSATWVRPVASSELTASPTITIATPLFDRDGQRIGVLAAILNVERIDRIVLQQTGLGETGETYVVGTDHRFVHARLSQAQSGAVLSTGINSALAGRDGRGLYENYRGEPVIGVYRWLGEIGAALVAEQTQDEAFAPARRLAFTTGGIGLAVVALLGFGIYVASRRVARPILAIAETASAVAAGDLEREAPVMTNDEVGLLARVFNDMTAKLHERERRLKEQVQQLRIEIDEARAAQKVAEITDTDYFRDLQKRAGGLRRGGGGSTDRE